MGFQFQRRINLNGPWGVNLSKSGATLSFRTKAGSVSTKGFSLRTGIPGVGYRFRAKKGSGVQAFLGIILLAIALVPIVINISLYLLDMAFKVLMLAYWLFLVVPIKIIKWVLLTAKDYYVYKKEKNTSVL